MFVADEYSPKAPASSTSTSSPTEIAPRITRGTGESTTRCTHGPSGRPTESRSSTGRFQSAPSAMNETISAAPAP